jgi:hypothetical protein
MQMLLLLLLLLMLLMMMLMLPLARRRLFSEAVEPVKARINVVVKH